MKPLAGGLALLCLVLLFLAFDEGQARSAYEALRYQAWPAVQGLAARLTDRTGTPPVAPAAGTNPVIFGRFAPRGDAPTGELTFEGASIRLESGGAWRTEPHRIAYGREGFAAPLNRRPEDQLELRRLLPAQAKQPLAGAALCGGDTPGWIALRPHGARLDLMLFRAGPPPGSTDSDRALCGRWVYDRR